MKQKNIAKIIKGFWIFLVILVMLGMIAFLLAPLIG